MRVKYAVNFLRYAAALTDFCKMLIVQVKSEIHKMLKKAADDLEELGGKRETAAEQSQYLLKISMAFQQIVTSALSANYVGSDWFDQFPILFFQ